MTCIRYQKVQCEKAGVQFHLGTEVTEDLIKDELPDSVVLATGPTYSKIKAPGFDTANVVNVLDVLRGVAKVGDNIIVWATGNRALAWLSPSPSREEGDPCGKEKSAGFDINPSFKWRYMIFLSRTGSRLTTTARSMK